MFTLTPVTIGAAPTNISNGQANGISVVINSVSTSDNSFSAQTQSGATFTVKSNASTVYQGLTAFWILPRAESPISISRFSQTHRSLRRVSKSMALRRRTSTLVSRS